MIKTQRFEKSRNKHRCWVRNKSPKFSIACKAYTIFVFAGAKMILPGRKCQTSLFFWCKIRLRRRKQSVWLTKLLMKSRHQATFGAQRSSLMKENKNESLRVSRSRHASTIFSLSLGEISNFLCNFHTDAEQCAFCCWILAFKKHKEVIKLFELNWSSFSTELYSNYELKKNYFTKYRLKQLNQVKVY